MKKMLAVIAMASALAITTGCDEDSAERAGERLDRDTERVRDKLEDAGEKAGDNLEKAGDKIEDAARDAKRDIRD
jgi:hypothetical protein